LGWKSLLLACCYQEVERRRQILVELWSARKWIARIMISWGLIAALTGFVHTAREFYWARFLLGVAEAGFLPGVIVYLTHWYRSADRAKAIALFMSAIPVARLVDGYPGRIYGELAIMGMRGFSMSYGTAFFTIWNPGRRRAPFGHMEVVD
jgi:MFS family permease